MTTVIICSGGPKEEIFRFQKYKAKENVYFIGVDRGSIYLLEEGIVPDEIVGDFDSLTEEEWTTISNQVQKITKVNAEKDDTDTDLALEKALVYQPTEILISGVTGGRLDHFEAAIRSMYRLQSQNLHMKVKIVNKKNEISFLFPGEHSLLFEEKYRYLSFFAFDKRVENVTLRGVKYEVTNQNIEVGSSRFTSNELISKEGHISFSSGICLVIRSSD